MPSASGFRAVGSPTLHRPLGGERLSLQKDSEAPLKQNPHMDTPDAKDEAPPSSLSVLEYGVVRHRGHWRVLHIGKHSAPYDSQDAAIAAAVARAKESVAQGRMALVRLIRTDGEERLIDLILRNEHK